MAAIGLLLESQTSHVHGSLEKISVFTLIIKAQAGSLTAGTQPLGVMMILISESMQNVVCRKLEVSFLFNTSENTHLQRPCSGH